MFDCDVGQIINGVDIDRPQNAMSLSPRCHASFGSFKIYLEAVPGEEHTYRVDSLIGAQRRLLNLPVTRKLFLNEERSIEPPLPRLLALHGAIAHVLHLSGAGEYIDKILRDYEDMGVHEDGTTELGRLINWRLGECFDGAVDVH